MSRSVKEPFLHEHKADLNLVSMEKSGDPFFLQQTALLLSHILKAVSHFFVSVFNIETNDRILFWWNTPISTFCSVVLLVFKWRTLFNPLNLEDTLNNTKIRDRFT